ncbi:eCIS core domain-containing protein [Streptomyces sp. T028]|uniref:eCIS core domain-containing protein n=1 Tax=Streptomyces sp. T028 TaxID=3394379 RepID=UPI003A891BB4
MSAVTPVRQQQPEPPRRGRAKRSTPLRDKWLRRTPPAPDAVLAQAGKPLERGVGRAMEEWLGHDFSAVRIHSDRDAAALAALVGADAVAVGQDIFFAAGAYRPETAQGLRLLAHELLHTVQVPDAPGRLRLGRQDGTLSRPLDGVEREAEERVDRASGDRGAAPAGGGEQAVRERGAQPVSWLRFISVDVSQLRAEQLDPAALVDRIVAGVVRTLRGDPADAAGRVRQQLVRLAPELQSAVLARLQQRLPSADYARVEQLVVAAETSAGTPVDTAVVPEPVVEPAERERTERRDRAERKAGDERGRADRERDGGDEERQGAEDRDRERTGEDAATKDEQDRQDAERKKGAALDDQRRKDSAEEDEQKREDEEHRKATEKGEKPEAEGKEQPAAEGGPAQAEAAAQGAAAPPAVAAPGAEAGGAGAGGAGPEPIGQAPVVGAQAGTAAPVGSGGADPVREDRAEAVANDPQGPLAQHGLAKQPGRQDEPPEQEKPLHTESGAESEVPAPEAAAEPEPPQQAVDRAEQEAGADKPEPDPVPKTDPDLSAVPTADEELKAAPGTTPPKPRELPTMPAPPPVEAEPRDLDRAEKAEQAAEPELERADAEAPQDRAVEAEGEQAESDTPATAPAADATEAAPGGPAEAAPATTTGSAEPATANPAASAPAASTAAALSPAATGPAATGAGPASAAPAAAPVTAEPAAVGDSAGPAPVGTSAGAGGTALGPGAQVPGEPRPTEPMPGDPHLAEAAPAGGPVVAQSAAPGQPGPDGAAPGAGPEGSLEAGGGGCAGAPAATTEADAQGGEGGGGCGGGGGGGGGAPAPAEKKAQAQPPDVSGQEPTAALATISSQPPAGMPQALGGVDQAVGTTVGKEHQDLQGAPPTLERPSGAPQTQSGAPQTGGPVSTAVEPMTEVTPQTLAKQREANPPPTANTPNPATRVKDPVIAGGNEEKASDAEIQQLQGAVGGVPTSDDRLYTTVGAAPRVRLEGETDPALADEQHRQTEDRINRTHTLGRQDAAVGLGEDQIYPNAPGETLTASVPGRTPAGGTPAAAGGPGGGGTDPDTVSAVAVQERGPQIQAGFADGQGRMGQAQQDKQTQSDQAKADNQAQVQQAIAENSDQQAAVRQEAREDAAGRRGEWRDEQDRAVEDNTRTATDAHTQAREDTGAKKAEADADIEKRKNEDNDRIERERRAAEEKARKEREAKKEESSGWWGWVKSKVKAAFNALVSAIKGLFDLAVKAIDAIKEGFKKAINGLIDLAAKAITGIIKGLANALLAVVSVIGTVFPGIAEKMRKAIISMRDAAIAKVQQLADRLKKAVNALIDALAGALVAVLRAYEKLLLAAVEVVRGVVMKAIEFVESAIKLLGELAALVKDIAPDPIGWIRKLGGAAKEGVRTFLWGAIKTAVKAWFNDKVESVVGIGKMLWNVLVKGCMSVAQIGRMAWQAIVKSLPAMIISIVIEKLIGLIVPAAGGIIAIAQGVMAAYQSISRIIAAFSAFLTFLKAVKAGGVAAACLFAKAVAAGAVALLEFITNFLMVRIASALKGVGTKLKGIAEKIMKGLGRGARAVKKTAGRAVNAARQAVRRGVAAVKGGAVATARAVRRGVTAGARAVRSGASRVGAAAKSGLRGAADGVRRAAGAVGRVVGPALKTVNRTIKRLGTKLANSRLGRALKASARKLKNLVAKGKQKFKDWRKNVADRRKQNRQNKKKRPQESKEQRLARIIARLRPVLRRLLKSGVRKAPLIGVLAGLRIWYRLKRLSLSNGGHGQIRAGLSPEQPVTDEETVRLLDINRRVDKKLDDILRRRRERSAREDARQPSANPPAQQADPTTLTAARGGHTLAEHEQMTAQVAAGKPVKVIQAENSPFRIEVGSNGVFSMKDPKTGEMLPESYFRMIRAGVKDVGPQKFQGYLRSAQVNDFASIPATRQGASAVFLQKTHTLAEGLRAPEGAVVGRANLQRIIDAHPDHVASMLKTAHRESAWMRAGSVQAFRQLAEVRSRLDPAMSPADQLAYVRQHRDRLSKLDQRYIEGVRFRAKYNRGKTEEQLRRGLETPIGMLRKEIDILLALHFGDGLVVLPEERLKLLQRVDDEVIDMVMRRLGFLDPRR